MYMRQIRAGVGAKGEGRAQRGEKHKILSIIVSRNLVCKWKLADTKP